MYIVAILAMAVLIGIDQITKFLTIKYLMPVGSVDIINNFFQLTYVENRGAAFGSFQGAGYIFVAVALVILVLGCFSYAKVCKNNKGVFVKLAHILIGAGAIGNVIDRVFRHYVVDMLNFNIFGYDFPVFNFADICVCVGAALLVIYVLFDGDKK